MLYFSYAFSLMSETVFVLGALTIWTGNVYTIVAIFSIIGLAKYLTASRLLHIKQVNKVIPVAILAVLTSLSFIMHLAFLTNMTESALGKANIAQEYVTSSSNKKELLQDQKSTVQKRLSDIDNQINQIPANYVTKKRQYIESTRSEVRRLHKQLDSINTDLLKAEDSDLNYKVESVSVNSQYANNLKPLSDILGFSQSSILSTINIAVALIIDLFALYFAYSTHYTLSKIDDEFDTVNQTESIADTSIPLSSITFGQYNLENFKSKRLSSASIGAINIDTFMNMSDEEIYNIVPKLKGETLDWFKCAVVYKSFNGKDRVFYKELEGALSQYGLSLKD